MSIGKVIKKFTSILLIVAMIMTSAGIQTFADSIDDVVNEAKNEKVEENLNRKYYDGLVDPQENSTEEKFENEGENNSQDKVEEKEKKNSEDQGSDDGAEESEEESSNDGYEEEPEEDETTKASNEESEEDETTIDPSEESQDPDEEKESDKKESEENSSVSDADTDDKDNDDKENNDKGNTEDKIEENETDEESIATDSEASDDADTTEEADATEDEIDNATKSELDDEEIEEASSSDADEVGDAEESKPATIATYSELFTVATDSKLLRGKEEIVASDSDAKLYGWSDTVGREIPNVTIWGDVGYRIDPMSWVNKGYFHYMLYRNNDEHKLNNLDGQKNPNIPADFRYFYWTEGKDILAFNIWGVWRLNKGRAKEYPLEDWLDTTKAMTKGGITPNILGFVYNEVGKSFTPVDGVTFDNNWDQQIQNGNFEYHLDGKDKQTYAEDRVGGASPDISVTCDLNGKTNPTPDGDFKIRLQGMYITNNSQERRIRWENDGWKDGDFTHRLFGHYDRKDTKNGADVQKAYLLQMYEASIKNNQKNISYTSGGKRYKLIGWTNMYHVMDPWWNQWGGKSLYKAIETFTNNDSPAVASDGMKIWYKDAWDAVSFGPNYRDGNNGAWREGYRFGMMDQGVMMAAGDGNGGVKSKSQWKGGSGPWSGITVTSRKSQEEDEIEDSSLKYRLEFMSPVFEEIVEKDITFDKKGGEWVEGYNPPTKYDSDDNETAVPTADNIKRFGYTFQGWYATAMVGLGVGTIEITKLGKDEIKKGITTVFASWKSKDYSIKFNDGKVKGSDGVDYTRAVAGATSGNYNYETTVTMPKASDMALTGFNLLGFATKSDATSVIWKCNTTYNVKDMGVKDGETLNIYPVYAEKTYKINLYGGSVVASDNKEKKSTSKDEGIELKYYQKLTFAKDKLELTGFNLKGFNKDNKKTDATIPAGTEIQVKDYVSHLSESETKSFYGVWDEKKYEIEFKAGKKKGSDNIEYEGIGSVGKKTYKYFETVILPTGFALTDFTLIGYGYTNGGDAKTINVDAKSIAGNIAGLSETNVNTLYGVWKENEVTITFYGGRKKASDNIHKESKNKVEKKYPYKSTVSVPQDFTLEGFNFKGFNIVNESDTVTLELSENNKNKATSLVSTYGIKEGKLDFYGVWKEKEYLLTILAGTKEVNGKTYVGTGTIATKSYSYHSNVTMPNTLTMRGFKLVGFNKDDNKEEADYNVDDIVEIKDLITYLTMHEYTEENEEANKLYAVYEISGATIVLNADIGAFETNKKRKKTLNVTKAGKSLGEYTGYEEPTSLNHIVAMYGAEGIEGYDGSTVLDEYEFTHWEDAEGNKYTSDTKIVGDLELKAFYKEKTTEEVNETLYDIAIDNDSVKGTYAGPASFKLKLGSNVLASMSEIGIPNPTNSSSWTFVGWSFDGVNVIDDSYVYADTSLRSLKAIYSENAITIVLSAKTGEFSGGKRVITIISTESKALNNYKEYEEPTKEDWVFKRWLDGSVEVASTSIMTRDITLIADYATKSDATPLEDENTEYYLEIFNEEEKGTYEGPNDLYLKFGSNVLASMSEAGVKDPVAKEGWKFLGWSYTEDGKDSLIKSTDKFIDIDKDSIYAVYSKVAYTVVLSAGDGEFEDGTKSKKLESETELELSKFTGYEEPTKTDYEFIRWVDVNGAEVATTSIIKSNTTLFARYKKVGQAIVDGKYIITIDNDDTKGVIKVNGEEKDVVRFKIGFNQDILATLASESITAEAKTGFVFKGWSWSGDLDDLIKDGDKFDNTDYISLKAVYTDLSKFQVILRSNTGVFEKARSRKISFETNNSETRQLKNYDKYEEPIKSNAEFYYWLELKEDGSRATYSQLNVVDRDLILDAIYKDNTTGEEIGKPDDGSGTHDGGDNATYTVMVKNDIAKGTMSNAEKKNIGGKDYEVALLELKLEDVILDKIEEKSINITPSVKYTFEGWSEIDNDIENLLKDDTKFTNKDMIEIYPVYYDVFSVHVILNANTGLFRNYQRTKSLEIHNRMALEDVVNYEEPTKSEGYTFIRWEDSTGKVYPTTYVFGKELDGKDVELFAIYKDDKDNTVGKGDTKDGGSRANYTVVSKYDVTKSSVSNTVFEVKKDDYIMQAMIDYDAYYPTVEAEGWWHKGWSFVPGHTEDYIDLFDKNTKYEDTDKTLVYAKYLNVNEWTITLDANTGLFKDNTRIKTIKNSKRIAVKDFPDYDIPEKSDGYTFDRWELADGTIFDAKDMPTDPFDFTLYAIYKDTKNNDIGKGDTKKGEYQATYTIRLSSDDTKGTLGAKTKFEIRIGELILATMSNAGIKDPEVVVGNYFVGWSWEKDNYDYAVLAENIYKGNEGTVLYALYSQELKSVTLRANTGLFSDDTREKVLQVPQYQLLKAVKGYEEPIKTDAKFNRWLKEDGTAILNLGTYKVADNQTLDAIYATGSNVIGTGDTKDGEDNATYTVKVKNTNSMGTYDGAEYFEIKKGEVVYTTMKASGVKEGTPKSGYAFKGWRLGSDLISALTTYEDTNLTYMTIEYDTQVTQLTFNASFGAFADGSREKSYVVARGRIINTIEEYEEPTKNKWTFNRWADESGNTVASTSEVPNVSEFNLKAMYKNRKGEEVDEDSHKHLVCGAPDEVSGHMTDVIEGHDTLIAYLPVTDKEEFLKYITDEFAKSEMDRKDIKIYLEEDIDLGDETELASNMNLYVCLNGYTLSVNKINGNGNVYISNCQLHEAHIVDKASASEISRPTFGSNGIHVLSARGKINVTAKGRFVNIDNSSASSKDVELMQVNIDVASGSNISTVSEFITAKGNSKVKLVDTTINNIKVEDSLIKTLDNAKFYVGGKVNVVNNKTNRAILEVNDTFEIAERSTFDASHNTIEKTGNGNTAVIFVGGDNNNIYGDLIVKDNKLLLSDEYKKLVKVEPVKVEDDTDESDDDSGLISDRDKELGTYAEEKSPAGEVGYSAAVAFTKDNISLNVRDSKIEIKDNESVASYSDVKAGYMYQIRAKDNSVEPFVKQGIGTELDKESIMEISFDTKDGEGLLTNNAKIIENNIFVNRTFGKEEKILDIQENSDGVLELRRKIYHVVYDEGAPTTNETKQVIEAFKGDGSTISETTRVRSVPMKAGYDISLENNDIYKAVGFRLSTYSIAYKTNGNKALGDFAPKSTISYLEDIYGDGEGIKDGDIISARANWDEQALVSEARELIITQEIYNQIVRQAVGEAAISKASQSDIEQVEEDSEENYYKVRYHLNGGHIPGIDKSEETEDYYEVKEIRRKDKYVLFTNVEKVATVSGVEKSYDFIGWSTTQGLEQLSADDQITEIPENYDGNEIFDVYAYYMPSTFKITYHLNGGSVEGAVGSTVEDTIVRLSPYKLITGVTKENSIFTGWTVEEVSSGLLDAASAVIVKPEFVKEFKAETVKSDLNAYANYESALYDVKYILNGGVIAGKTKDGDETFVDSTANIQNDYYLYTDVTKADHKFTGWETTGRGEKVSKIEAGDTDKTKREVIATFAPTTWEINYDTDGGNIVGTSGGNIKEKLSIDKSYVLYTEVVKEGWDFDYWYDVDTKEKVESISNAKGGAVYRVKAKYKPIAYDLVLHIDDTTTKELKNISLKEAFVLPTDIVKENTEFLNWYYIDESGNEKLIDTISKGNPKNITDVYLKLDDLMTHKIIYHLGKDEEIEGMDTYDQGSTNDKKTITIKKNRREKVALNTNVTKPGYEFVGWSSVEYAEGYFATEEADPSTQTYNFADGYSKSFEEKYKNVIELRDVEFHYYANFVLKDDKSKKVEIVYHIVGGGGEISRGAKIDDTTYVETVVPTADISLSGNGEYDDQPKWILAGVFYTEEEAQNPSSSHNVSNVVALDKMQEKLGQTLDVYLAFAKNTYNVKYYLEGGTVDGKALEEGTEVYEVEYLNINTSDEMPLLSGVKKEGYIFDGWFTERDGKGEKIKDVRKNNGEKDYAVYAYWKSINYNVTYVLHGGQLSGKVGETYTKTYSRLVENEVETGAVYEGHVFDGWYTGEGGQGTKYEKLPASEKEVEDLTLHANFIKSTYTVTYILNGGKLKGKTLIDGMYYKESYSNQTDVELIPKSEIMYDDGVFTGWEDGESVRYTTIPKDHVGDIVVEAKYSTETTTITFNIGSKGAVEGKIAIDGKFTETFNLAEDSVLPTNVRSTLAAKFNRLGKTYDMMYFDGWYTTPTYTGSPVTILKEGNPENITTLYAKWSSSMYMIVYHLNGGTITGIARNDVTDMSDERFVIFEDYELPKEVTHNFGTFEGWYDNQKCTGSPITKLTARSKYIKNGVVELYAKLPKTKYVVKYFVEPASGGFTQCASKVDNSASYVLDSSNFALDTNVKGNIRFDGWYKKENGEFVGNEIISLPKGTTEDIDVYGKLVDVSTLDEEELAAFEAREAKREELRSAAKEKRKQEINDNAKKEAEKVKENMQPQNNGYLDEDYINSLIQEDRKDAIQKQEQAKAKELAYSAESKGLLGAVREFVSSFGDLILGDDDDGSTSVASPNEIQVKVSDLLAYDTVSAKNLGIEVPSGKVLNAVIVTYIKDLAGNFVDDYSIVGTMLSAGSNLSKIADAYPDHTFGVRAIIVDKSILTPPSSPSKRPSYYGGGTTGGGGGGGGGGGVGGALPAGNNTIIVNPYGYDGRGKDNGALRAGILKLHVNSKIGRIATPSFGDYKTINMSAGSSSLMGLSDETWEYFPASNEFKLFMSAPNGDRYYLTNGWHKRVVNSKNMWYRFDNDGIMQRGFVEEGGNVYYLNNSLSELAYMVTGFKDFEGTGYTGYFRNDGVLVAIFPTTERVVYETKLLALPDKPSFDRSIYEKCRNYDSNSTRIVKSVKTYGQSVMGNFVGYWYYMASGTRKLRFETINTELQIARFANNGWINAYDTDNKLHSYRFDDATNLLVNTITPEGFIVSQSGQMSGKDILLDFSTIDVTKESGYVLAVTTLNTLPTNSRKLQSHLVAYNGVPVSDSPATDIWTVIDFQGVEPVLTNMVYGGSSIQPVVPQVQPLQLLSNAANAISSTFGLTQTEETIPIIDAAGIINPNSIVKMTKVLSNVDFEQGAKIASEIVSSNNITSVYSLCMNIYSTLKGLFAA